MTCKDCEHSATRLHWGGYSMRCARCCARLVRSARPAREQQEAMLYAVALRKENPKKPAILAALKAMDAEAASKPNP